MITQSSVRADLPRILSANLLIILSAHLPIIFSTDLPMVLGADLPIILSADPPIILSADLSRSLILTEPECFNQKFSSLVYPSQNKTFLNF